MTFETDRARGAKPSRSIIAATALALMLSGSTAFAQQASGEATTVQSEQTATQPATNEETKTEETAAGEPVKRPQAGTDAPAQTQDAATGTAEPQPQAQAEPQVKAQTTEGAAPSAQPTQDSGEAAAPAPAAAPAAEQSAPAEGTAPATAQGEQPAAPAAGTEQPAGQAQEQATGQAEGQATGQAAEQQPAPAAQPTQPAAPAPATAEGAPRQRQPAPAGAATAGQPTAPAAGSQAATAPAAAPASASAPVTVVNENQSAAEREALAAAEAERRRDKKKRRAELIGAGLAGLAVGAAIAGSNATVVGDEGDRVILRDESGRTFVRKDENALLRDERARVFTEDLPRGRQRTTVVRPNGVEVETVRDRFGNIETRLKRFPNGDEIVLIDNRDLAEAPRERPIELGPLRIDVSRDGYIVESDEADRDALLDALTAAPVEEVERAYSLREIRDNRRLRAKLRRIDLNTVNFQTGSAIVTRSQVAKLDQLAASLNAAIERDPSEVFLIEGHTDAVGDEISNLTLSDRRAETVARILIEEYGVPAENLVVEGYGESDLKVDTADANAENRRVTLRRITPLLRAG